MSCRELIWIRFAVSDIHWVDGAGVPRQQGHECSTLPYHDGNGIGRDRHIGITIIQRILEASVTDPA